MSGWPSGATSQPVENPSPLLSGEPSDHADAEDAEHWLQVYGELQGFVRGLIDTYSAQRSGLDEQRYRALIQRLRVINQRVAYWDRRRRDLRLPGRR